MIDLIEFTKDGRVYRRALSNSSAIIPSGRACDICHRLAVVLNRYDNDEGQFIHVCIGCEEDARLKQQMDDFEHDDIPMP